MTAETPLELGSLVRIAQAHYDPTRPDHRGYEGKVGTLVPNHYDCDFAYAVRLGNLVVGMNRADLEPLPRSHLLALPADWEAPAFHLGQLVFRRNWDNERVRIIGVEYVSPRLHTLGPWWTYRVADPNTLQALGRTVDEEDLSAEPLLTEDPDWQEYVRKGGDLEWAAWRLQMDHLDALIVDTPTYKDVYTLLLLDADDPV